MTDEQKVEALWAGVIMTVMKHLAALTGSDNVRREAYCYSHLVTVICNLSLVTVLRSARVELAPPLCKIKPWTDKDED